MLLSRHRTRRGFLGGVAAAGTLAGAAARAQQPARVPRIAYLSLTRPPHTEAFLSGLRDLGYVEGETIRIEWAIAEGRPERIPALAQEVAASGPDIIVAATNLAALPAKQATRDIPIVVIASHDGIGTGLFASLSRPGANLTGVESLAREIDLKRLELLKAIVPSLARIAVVYNPDVPGAPRHVAGTAAAARSVGLDARLYEIRVAAEADEVLAAVLRDGGEGLLPITDPLIFATRGAIARFALKHRLPGMYEFKAFVEEGGLISYGPDLHGMWRRAAYYVDRILKGAKPGDLPVEQPTKFELVLNLKTAKVLGLTIPPTLLARADEVIE